VAGGGVAAVYLSIYAAFVFYGLLDRSAAFGLMVAATAGAAWLAGRERWQGLAMTSVVGGFSTPFLIGGDPADQVPLFTYDAILVAGTMYLARLRAWPLLNLASYVLTVMTVAGWIESSFRPSEYLVTEGFLTLFTGMFLYIFRENRRTAGDAAQMAGLALASSPFFYYVASLQILADRPVPLLVFLVGITVAGLLVLGPEAAGWKRLVLWASAMVPFSGWVSQYGQALPVWVGTSGLVALYGMHLVAQLLQSRGVSDRAEVALLHGNGLALLFGGTALIDGRVWTVPGALALAVAAWNGGLAAWMWGPARASALHCVALAAVALAAAIAQAFESAWWTVGWAAEGAGLLWLALRERRNWMAVAGFVLLIVALTGFSVQLWNDVPLGYRVLANQRVAIGAFLVVLLYGLARLLGHTARMTALGLLANPDTCLVAANILTVAVATHEIDAFWDLRDAGRTGYLARHVMFSSTWAFYAVGLIVAGITRSNAALRYLAISLFGLTSLKVFLVDLSALDRIYRILSIVVLGVLLLVASYLYQRYLGPGAARSRPTAEEVP
jgi:uncharacterized membrane protein